jgi:hypothetical protein
MRPVHMGRRNSARGGGIHRRLHFDGRRGCAEIGVDTETDRSFAQFADDGHRDIVVMRGARAEEWRRRAGPLFLHPSGPLAPPDAT